MSKPDWLTDGRDWPNREHSRFIEAGGVRWHVQISGQGPAILLLHGTGAATHSWRGLLPLLATEFTVIAPDLPGHGFTSSTRDGAMTLPFMATALAALLGVLGHDPALTVGNSAGAAIAVRMLLDGAIGGPLVSINGALMPFAGAAGQIFPSLARLLFVNPFVPRLFALQGQSSAVVQSFLERSTGSQIDREGLVYYQRLFARSGHCAGPLAMMAHWDLASLARDYPRLHSPVTLVHGENDRAVPPGDAQKIKAMIRHADIITLSGLGHLAHEEAPDQIAQIIRNVAQRHAIIARPASEAVA